MTIISASASSLRILVAADIPPATPPIITIFISLLREAIPRPANLGFRWLS